MWMNWIIWSSGWTVSQMMKLPNSNYMAFKLGKLNMTGLINLTFCCQEATVITDFSDLEGIGRAHYMNLYGGGASIEELEQLDGVETALLLITENEGTITPYGVVYANGMQLSQIYQGRNFPEYLYEESLMTVSLRSVHESDDSRERQFGCISLHLIARSSGCSGGMEWRKTCKIRNPNQQLACRC